MMGSRSRDRLDMWRVLQITLCACSCFPCVDWICIYFQICIYVFAVVGIHVVVVLPQEDEKKRKRVQDDGFFVDKEVDMF